MLAELEIKTNSAIFEKPADSNVVLKSKTNNSTFAINAKQWAFVKNTSNNAGVEYNLNLKEGDLYAMIITERIEIAVEDLIDIAFENAKSVAPDAKVIKKEYRIVNGKKIIYMEMTGTIKGIKFQYLGYYFSDASGSTQYVVFTGENLVNQYKIEIDHLLNGFYI